MKRCQVCSEAEAKYRCPRCNTETCCLECVKQHKVNTDCSGQRDKTAYVKLSDFNDRNLLNDYRLLEDTGRKNNNAARDVLKRKHNRPNFLRELEKQAGIRKINLRLMPYPMSRRKSNSTNYQNRLKKMFWQIEWVFADVDLTLIDKRICEDDTLESVLEKHVGVDSDPVVRHKIKPYITAGRENWKLFMRYENTSADKPQFYKLDLTQSLLENFRYKQIVEYPSIHIVLPSNPKQYITVPTEQIQAQNTQEKLLATEEKLTSGVDTLSTEKLTTAVGNELDKVLGTESKNENVTGDILPRPIESVT
ncbi:box C/D snoRNA protein 1-like [Ruditapes philippinarum]|uniref:box C/D snoRNA protein 1-like n=1 Tax=Ruditapes philippinarum TaxID=129788 RepID=UPI00295B065C|nr:box C/D snoRNA protein 1-like [Ruditapes philippinarum]